MQNEEWNVSAVSLSPELVRLAQQKQARFGHQGPADGQHLLLAAGKRARQLLLALQQAREKIKNPFQGAFAAGLVPDAECAQAQILQHAHGPEDPAALRGLGYAQAYHLMTGQAQQGLAFKENLAFTGTHQTADGQQGGAFARAVGPEDGDDLALLHAQIDAVQHFHAAVAHPDV